MLSTRHIFGAGFWILLKLGEHDEVPSFDRYREQCQKSIAVKNTFKDNFWHFAEDFSEVWSKAKISQKMRELSTLPYVEYEVLNIPDRREPNNMRTKGAIRLKQDYASFKKIMSDFLITRQQNIFFSSDFFDKSKFKDVFLSDFKKEVLNIIGDDYTIFEYPKGSFEMSFVFDLLNACPKIGVNYLENIETFRRNLKLVFDIKGFSCHEILYNIHMSTSTTIFLDSVFAKKSQKIDYNKRKFQRALISQKIQNLKMNRVKR